uniref:Uncharacterized protein n=1 Tax=Rhizophora mucronata TaxID=61149 RepID=A0A2P2ITQ7_RHIMU
MLTFSLLVFLFAANLYVC